MSTETTSAVAAVYDRPETGMVSIGLYGIAAPLAVIDRRYSRESALAGSMAGSSSALP